MIPASLDKILWDWSTDDVERLLSTFSCKRNSDLERFLREDAIKFHKKHRSRTYLFLSEDERRVLAYVTLGIKSMKIPNENYLSNSVKKEMDAYQGLFQSYLIGQLGKSDGAEKGIGPELIHFSLSIFEKSCKSIGCNTVRVDCSRELIKFYEDNGFKLISQDEDEKNHYHLVTFL